MASLAGQEYLYRAKVAYNRDKVARRDSLLECGRNLHLFVSEYLKPGLEMYAKTRQEAGFTRVHAIKIAADELGTYPNNANAMIVRAKVVEFLGSEGLGDISYSVITEFGRFIRRVGDYPRNKVHNPLAENWRIRPKLETVAKELFRRAVAENWTHVKANVECNKAAYGDWTHKRRLRDSHLTKTALEQLERCFPRASPGDIVETILGLIAKAEDPAAVAVRLRVMLERFLPSKAKAV